MTTCGDTLLHVSDLVVSLGGSTILSDVALDVPRGGSVGLVGETGSGKSITCRAVLGLLPSIGAQVDRGSISFDGTELASADSPAWRPIRGRRIAFVPQASLNSLDPVMTIGRQLRETIRIIDPDTDSGARAVELLDLVHMPRLREVLRSYPHQLSGGMRQRVSIALALAGSPDLLVADEPTTALDVTVQRMILDLFGELRRDTGMALLLVTHDLGVVAKVADAVSVMYAGTVVESGPTTDVLAHPRHPYTQALLGTLPGARRRDERLTAIAGQPPHPGAWPTGCRFAPRCPRVHAACTHEPPVVQVDRSTVACSLYSAEAADD